MSDTPEWFREWTVRVETSLAELRTMLKSTAEQGERTEKKVNQVNRFITGESEPERGLNMRVDRLEGAEMRRKLVVNWTGAASIAALVAALFAWLKGHP